MSRIATIAAEVIAGVALIATGAGAIAFGTIAGISVAGVSTTAMFAASAGLTAVAALTAKQPKQAASPTAWKADPQAGIPYAMGECYNAGDIRYRMAYGKDNTYQTLVTVLSGGGPHVGPYQLYLDNVARSYTPGGAINIPDQNFAFANVQLGQQPEPQNLTCAPVTPYQWTSDCKLSGYAATIVTLKYDTKGKHTLTTTPNIGWYGKWARVYDPRKDSTYPGGNGTHRWTDESTWEYSANPYLNALTWLIGRRHNGKLVLGAGIALSGNGVIVSQFVDGANVADANGWKCCGVVYSTDDKWDVLKKILRAGSGQPMKLYAQIGCLVDAPKVSLATVAYADLAGKISVQTTQPRKDRINAVVPRYMGRQDVVTQDSDGNNQTTTTFDMLAGSPVIVDSYVAFDGKIRQKQIDYEMVSDLTQSQQLARYAIENAREFGPIVLKLKLRWLGYRPGDVITVDLPEDGLNGQDVLILQRAIDPSTASVTLTCRTETAGKHAFALGQTGTAPETPSVTGPALIPTPGESAWALVGGTITSASGTTIPVLQITGAADSDVIDAVVFQYRTSATQTMPQPGTWTDVGQQAPTIGLLDITGVQDQTAYDVSVAYRKGSATGDPLILGPAVAGQTAVPWQTGVVGAGKPADGADVTAVVFQALEAGRSPQQVLTDLDAAATATAIEAATAGGWRSQSDQIIYMADGTPVRQTVEQLGITVGGHSAFITELQEVGGDGSAKYLISVNSDGHIVGMEAFSGGGVNQLSFVASQFLFVDDSGANPINAMLYSDGVWKMHSIEVDTLKVNTAMVPVRVVSGSYVNGSYGGTGFAAPRAPVLTASVVVAVPGWIETTFKFVQGLTSTNGNWSASVAMNGTDDVYSLIADGTSQANDFTQGSFYCGSPGTYTITGQWAAVPGVQIRERSLFIKFFPKTA